MSLQEKVLKTAKKFGMFGPGDTVLVGLSGGADSVCLLKILHAMTKEYNLALHAVYVDHGLRPDETPAEIEFAKRVAEGSAAVFHCEKIDVASYARQEGLGKQEAARILRYDVYEGLAGRLGANRIALGHTADDQTETFFMRLLRGGGRRGLSGIPPVRKIKGKHIVRPLIETTRAEIEEFLAETGTDFITDPTNLKNEYTRNKIRHDLVPVLKKFNPNLDETILRTTQILAEEERYFESAVLKGLMRLLRDKTEEGVELFLVPLETMDTVLLRRTLRKVIELVRGIRGLDFGHVEDIIGLIKKGKPGDRLYLPGPVRAVKKYSTLLVTARPPARLGAYRLTCPGSVRFLETGALIKAYVERVGESARSAAEGAPGSKKVVLDAEKTGLELTMRGRQNGDYFCPLGFGRRKKLQDFFVDEKVPRDERDGIPIVLSGDDIVWVAGMRADERFRAGEDAKNFLVLEITQAAG
ncbi:MAG: tRNA lysidine(34) synthetase TilS [Nitrospiraceae bacterium]|nr:tRNA lysidine(34) synthetase TilS [Nitrospiraceae bacterium]